MSDIRLRVAQSLADYMAVVDALTPMTLAGLWFRGQSNAEYRLTPSALRNVTQTTDRLGLPLRKGQFHTSDSGEVIFINVERMRAAFKRQARPFIERPLENEFEWSPYPGNPGSANVLGGAVALR